MSNQNPENSLNRLLDRLCIEGLAPGEWKALAGQIADDENALLSYIEAVQWEQSLGYLVGEEITSDRAGSLPFDELEQGKSVDDSLAKSVVIADSPPPNQINRSTSWRSRNYVGWGGIAVSAAFLAGVGITAIALQLNAERSPSDVADASRGPAVLAAPQPAPFVQESRLGEVTGLSLDASADGLLRSLQVGQELRCGEVVQLTLGFMRVALHSGPELIIEGPAEFSIIGTDSVFVRVGRVSASGPKKLLLQSPLLTAECNDADVSFIAEEDSSTNVYAYKGVVTMESISHREGGNGKLAVLHEGQGLRVHPEITPAQLTKFTTVPTPDIVRSWAQVEARLSESQRLVLSDRPIAYWPLHRVRRNRRVLDLTQHGFDGQAIGNWPAELPDLHTTHGEGAYFNGESYIEPDRKPPIDLRAGFTVEGWAKVRGGAAYQSIFTSRWVLDAHTPHLQCSGFTLYAGQNDRWQLWTGSGRYGVLWRELHSDVELVRNQWTHVVASFEPEAPADGIPTAETVTGIVRIYADGELVAKDVHEMSLMDFEWPARIGAAEFVPNSLTAWLFRGNLRDIAVYNYPLEASRIRAHYAAGKTAG